MTLTFELTAKQCEIRDQLAGAQTHHLIYGGSRSGKTFVLCYAIHMRALAAPGSRHVIFRRHGVAVKQAIGQDTFPKMVEMSTPGLALKWREQDGYFIYPNGSEVWLAGLDDKERVDKILGREFATLYFNEASEIPLSSYQVALTRLAQAVKRGNGCDLPLRSYVDLNPTTRSHWTYRLWVDGINPDGEAPVNRSDYAVSVANPMDNVENLPPVYIDQLKAMPARARARFFEGVYTSDVEHALWRREWIKRTQDPPELQRVVVAVDPAASHDVGSDETGIICVGIDAGGNCYVLEDGSGKFRPEEWARRAIGLYHTHDADCIVYEANQGGEMVASVLRAQRGNAPLKKVTATRGKVTRAEPVAALYEQGRVFHVGEFAELENQMCAFTSDFDRKSQGYSPDRVDALVWGMTDLFPRTTRRTHSRGPVLRPLGTMA